MHLGKFNSAIQTLVREIDEGKTSQLLQDLISKLEAISGAPGNGELMSSYKSSLESLRQNLLASRLNTPYPTLRQMLSHIGAEKFLGEKFYERVIEAIEKNKISPHAAAQDLKVLQGELNNFTESVKSIEKAFRQLGVEILELSGGESELGISIPIESETKTLFDLASISKKWGTNLSPFVEIFSKDNEPIKIRAISSSDWQLYLATTNEVLLGISLAIGQINLILIGLIKTRKLIGELLNSGASVEAIQPVKEEADRRLKNELEKLSGDLVDENYRKNDSARKNELKVHLFQALYFLSQQLLKKTTIEIRVQIEEKEAKEEGAEEDSNDDQNNLEKIKSQIEKNMAPMEIEYEEDDLLSLQDLATPDDEDPKNEG